MFSCSLVVNVGRDETRKTENAINCKLKRTERDERSVLALLLEKIISLSVKYVFCQRLLHPKLMLELSKAGIVVFQWLGAKRIDDAGRITGGGVVEYWRSWMARGGNGGIGRAEINTYVAPDGKYYPLLAGTGIATAEVTGFDSVVAGRVKEKMQEMVRVMEKLWVEEVAIDWKKGVEV